MNEGYADDDVTLRRYCFECVVYLRCKFYSGAECGVHFPVAGNNVLSHVGYVFVLDLLMKSLYSFNAA